MKVLEVKKSLETLLHLAGFNDLEVEAQENPQAKTVKFLITSNFPEGSSGLLIGKGGENLFALEYILRAMTGKYFPDSSWRISLDVNNYLAIREEKLRELARKIAYQVSLSKKAVELPPMHPRDRRIIHLELSFSTSVTTESIGEGRERRVVIKPLEEE